MYYIKKGKKMSFCNDYWWLVFNKETGKGIPFSNYQEARDGMGYARAGRHFNWMDKNALVAYRFL